MNKFLRNVGFYLLIILVAISIIDYFSTKQTVSKSVEYTQFLHQVDAGGGAEGHLYQEYCPRDAL